MELKPVLWVTFVNEGNDSEEGIFMMWKEINAIVGVVGAERGVEFLFDGISISLHAGF
jgi:hypothetical protein